MSVLATATTMRMMAATAAAARTTAKTMAAMRAMPHIGESLRKCMVARLELGEATAVAHGWRFLCAAQPDPERRERPDAMSAAVFALPGPQREARDEAAARVCELQTRCGGSSKRLAAALANELLWSRVETASLVGGAVQEVTEFWEAREEKSGEVTAAREAELETQLDTAREQLQWVKYGVIRPKDVVVPRDLKTERLGVIFRELMRRGEEVMAMTMEDAVECEEKRMSELATSETAVVVTVTVTPTPTRAMDLAERGQLQDDQATKLDSPPADREQRAPLGRPPRWTLPSEQTRQCAALRGRGICVHLSSRNGSELTRVVASQTRGYEVSQTTT